MNLLCCFGRSKSPSLQPPPHLREIQRGTISTTATRSCIFQPNHQNHNHSSSSDNNYNYNYNITPLPRYTPRPRSIHEKTLEAHLRDPPISNQSPYSTALEEKRQHEYSPFCSAYEEGEGEGGENVTADDVSSAISFQSSYGNTSTATRETPPPPYSPRSCSLRGVSPVRSEGRVSVASSRGSFPEMVLVAQPRPVYRPDRSWVRGFDDGGRGSSEGRGLGR